VTHCAPATVTILTSGIGLGVYIPALLIQTQLSAHGLRADVEVLETYYTPTRREAHLAHKAAYHADFALAQMSNRMARDVQDCLDGDRIEALIQQWKDERRSRFIVWSGFWLPVIERYRKLTGRSQLHVDHCRIDAEISASFRIYPDLSPSGREIWLWNWNEKRIVHEIPVSPDVPIPFRDREDRLVVHGGGWGIGSYQSAASDLERTAYALDRVIQDPNEWQRSRRRDRAFTVDPAWHPWTRGAGGSHEFPPMGEVVHPNDITWTRNPDFHAFYDVIRRSKAIVSKPGGCTLIDSLSSATPVVLLEPYGSAERSNGRIWEHLGFGISYSAWRETGYDPSVLEQLHFNIMARTRTSIDYPRALAEELLQEATP
jgi:hypothetical protein